MCFLTSPPKEGEKDKYSSSQTCTSSYIKIQRHQITDHHPVVLGSPNSNSVPVELPAKSWLIAIVILLLITLVVINIGRIRSNTSFKRKIKQREVEFVLVCTTLEFRFCTSLPTWVQFLFLPIQCPLFFHSFSVQPFLGLSSAYFFLQATKHIPMPPNTKVIWTTAELTLLDFLVRGTYPKLAATASPYGKCTATAPWALVNSSVIRHSFTGSKIFYVLKMYLSPMLLCPPLKVNTSYL